MVNRVPLMGTIRIERRPCARLNGTTQSVWDVIRFVGPHAFYLVEACPSEAQARKFARGLAVDYGLLRR